MQLPLFLWPFVGSRRTEKWNKITRETLIKLMHLCRSTPVTVAVHTKTIRLRIGVENGGKHYVAVVDTRKMQIMEINGM